MKTGIWVPEEIRKEIRPDMRVMLELGAGIPVFCGVVKRATAGKESLGTAGTAARYSTAEEVPVTPKEINIHGIINGDIADACTCVQGAYKIMTHEEILTIFKEFY